MHLFWASMRQAQCCRGARFFAYSWLIGKFKGTLIKLKNVALEIFMEYFTFTILYILLLSYKPSNFAQAILPYAAG